MSLLSARDERRFNFRLAKARPERKELWRGTAGAAGLVRQNRVVLMSLYRSVTVPGGLGHPTGWPGHTKSGTQGVKRVSRPGERDISRQPLRGEGRVTRSGLWNFFCPSPERDGGPLRVRPAPGLPRTLFFQRVRWT